ncbi:hypothetical protein GA0115246_113298 [Streptomyces sp. SolWspMP-sol7th]|nr:hypothetical protein GA0115246_113298 [Streptomyces sp. SolWspMP-sol7th]
MPRLDERLRVVEEEEREVRERGGHRPPVVLQVRFVEVPAARAHDERGPFPRARGAGEVLQEEVPVEDGVPGRRGGVLEVGGPRRGARAVRGGGGLRRGRAHQLHVPLGEPRRGRRDAPRGIGAHRRRDEREVEADSGGEAVRLAAPLAQQPLAALAEGGHERAEEVERGGREDLVVARAGSGDDLDGTGRGEGGHRGPPEAGPGGAGNGRGARPDRVRVRGTGAGRRRVPGPRSLGVRGRAPTRGRASPVRRRTRTGARREERTGRARSGARRRPGPASGTARPRWSRRARWWTRPG